VISHSSGETEDTFIADFAVAMGRADQDRIIVPVRTDAKYTDYSRSSGIGAAAVYAA